MTVIAWLLVACFLTIFFFNWISYQNNPNQTLKTEVGVDGKAQVIIRPNRHHHYVFTGKVNGIIVEFMIDTGASSVSVPGNLANVLNLPVGNAIQVQTANGVIGVYDTYISSIEIGPIELKNIPANINPYISYPQILLGMSALRELNFSQQNGQLILSHAR